MSRTAPSVAPVVAACLLAVGLAACGPAPATPASSSPIPPTPAENQAASTVVRLGFAPPGSGGATLGGSGEYLAQAQGYFANEGLSIAWVSLDPGHSLAALLTGQIDVAVDGLGAGFFSTVQQGVDIRIVAPAMHSEPGASTALFVVRKDLIESGRVRDFADLKGLKIAIPARGNSGEYGVASALRAGGLTLGDVDLVQMDFKSMLAALASNAIDVAGALPEPLATIAVRNGSGVKWKKTADVVRGGGTVVVFSSHFAAQRDIGVHWMTAYLRGVREYNDAFVNNLHEQQTAEVLASALGIQTGLFNGMSMAYADPNGAVDVGSIQAQMDWYVEAGYLSAPIDLTRIVDSSFAEAAVARLGTYR